MNTSNNNNNTTREAGVDSKISPGTSTSDNSCKDGASSKSNNNEVCNVKDMLQNLSTADDKDITVSVCDNCGKEGIDVNNICNKCKIATYCNAACKKKHRHKHKKECEEILRRIAEINDEVAAHAAKLHDLALFKEPPPSQYGDCPICFLRMPLLNSGHRYKGCCGKVICVGCAHAPVYDHLGNIVTKKVCPFCRTPAPETDVEANERDMVRVEAGDPIAIQDLGYNYREGTDGRPQDYTNAFELYLRAGKLGSSEAYNNIGYLYDFGFGVEEDEKKAIHYYELAAMGGCAVARYNLGIKEMKAFNEDRALKHFMIAAKGGDANALKKIKMYYKYGYATKEDYMKALQSYQAYLGEIKSKQRDEAAAADDQYRYY